MGQREAHVGWHQKAWPRWASRTDTRRTQDLQRATIKRERRRRVTITQHHKVQLWQRWIARANLQWRRDRRVKAQRWSTNTAERCNDQSGQCAGDQALTHLVTR